MMEASDARPKWNAIARDVLTNPVIEEFTYSHRRMSR